MTPAPSQRDLKLYAALADIPVIHGGPPRFPVVAKKFGLNVHHAFLAWYRVWMQGWSA